MYARKEHVYVYLSVLGGLVSQKRFRRQEGSRAP